MTSPARTDDRSRLLWWALIGVVVLAGIVAVIASRGTAEDVTEDVRSQQTADITEGGEGTGGADATPPLPEFTGEGVDPAVGMTIPTVSGSTLQGEPLTIAADGQAKIILFVAHWCPHCQREIPLLTEHLRNNPLPDDVEVLTVSTGVAEERGNYPPQKWLESAGWPAPVLADSADSEAAAAYGLSAFPFFVVADADGTVVARTSGELTTDAFDALVEAAQTGSAPG